MANNKHPGGRPPKYTSKEEIQDLIDRYFIQCAGTILLDKKGKAVTDKYGHPIIVGRKPPTVTGLALALGFNSRMSLLNYQGKKEFLDTITRAKTRVEEYCEERLFDRDGVRGAQFSLGNNFKGWAEHPDPQPPDDLAAEEANKKLMNAIKEATSDGD